MLLDVQQSFGDLFQEHWPGTLQARSTVTKPPFDVARRVGPCIEGVQRPLRRNRQRRGAHAEASVRLCYGTLHLGLRVIVEAPGRGLYVEDQGLHGLSAPFVDDRLQETVAAHDPGLLLVADDLGRMVFQCRDVRRECPHELHWL